MDLDGAPLSTTGPLSQTVTITRDGLWTELPVKVTYPTGGMDTMSFTANTPNLVYGKAAGDSASNYLYGTNGQVDSLWAQGTLALHAFLETGTGLPDSVRAGGTDSLRTQYTYDAQRRVLDGEGRQWAYDDLRLRSDLWECRQCRRAWRRSLAHPKVSDAFGRDTADFAKGATYWVRTQYDTLNRVAKTWHRSVSNDTTVVTYDALVPTRVKVSGGSLYKTTSNALGWPTANSWCRGHDRSRAAIAMIWEDG